MTNWSTASGMSFPFAVRRRDDAALQIWKDNLLRQMHGHKLTFSRSRSTSRPPHSSGGCGQSLQSIPFGATRSYGQVAKAIGQPTATRAVARACATNPVAVAIPCHRVVRRSGDMGGYRWGVERKRSAVGTGTHRSRKVNGCPVLVSPVLWERQGGDFAEPGI